MGERFPGIEWYCDRCDANLNKQQGFDDHKYIWKCTKCGHKNSISRDNILYNTENGLTRTFAVVMGLARCICMYSILLLTIGCFVFCVDTSALPSFIMYPMVAYPILLLISLGFEKIIVRYAADYGIVSLVFCYIYDDVLRPFKEIGYTVGVLFKRNAQYARGFRIKKIMFAAVYGALVGITGILLHRAVITKWVTWQNWFNSVGSYLSGIDNRKAILISMIIWILALSVIAFIMFAVDKKRAKGHKWRISEATLIFLSVIGGALGAFPAMLIFRHKIRKPLFIITVPAMTLIHIAIVLNFIYTT